MAAEWLLGLSAGGAQRAGAVSASQIISVQNLMVCHLGDAVFTYRSGPNQSIRFDLDQSLRPRRIRFGLSLQRSRLQRWSVDVVSAVYPEDVRAGGCLFMKHTLGACDFLACG
jgi:hypothetical protein